MKNPYELTLTHFDSLLDVSWLFWDKMSIISTPIPMRQQILRWPPKLSSSVRIPLRTQQTSRLHCSLHAVCSIMKFNGWPLIQISQNDANIFFRNISSSLNITLHSHVLCFIQRALANSVVNHFTVSEACMNLILGFVELNHFFVDLVSSIRPTKVSTRACFSWCTFQDICDFHQSFHGGCPL